MFKWKKKYSLEIPDLVYEKLAEEADKRGITYNEMVQEVFRLGFVAFKLPLYTQLDGEFVQIALKGDK